MGCRAVVVVLAMLLSGGCTHHRVLQREGGVDAYTAANRLTQGRDAELRTTDGQVFRLYDLRFAPDSARGVVLGSDGNPIVIPTSHILEVRTKQRGRGALEGILFGVPLGVALGLAFPPEETFFFAGGGAADNALLGGLSGFFYGSIIGAIRGSRFVVQVR
jgi:hypothetical protein